jgi:prepilin-type N-terminal cleavage/methylation domain-containing protein
MMNLINKKSEKGFTLIELMIVVAIIGILAAIAIPQFAQYRIKAFNSAAVADAKTTVTAMEAAYTDAFTYPVQGATLSAAGPAQATIGSVTINLSKGIRLSSRSALQAYTIMSKHIGGDNCYHANQEVTTVVEMGGSVAGNLAAASAGTPAADAEPGDENCP